MASKLEALVSELVGLLPTMSNHEFTRIEALIVSERGRRSLWSQRQRENHEWARIRARVLWRDEFICQYCGYYGPQEPGAMGIDHQVPGSRGGAHSEANLVACCRWCNSEKGARIYPTEWAPNARTDDKRVRCCVRCRRFRPWHRFGRTVAEQAWNLCEDCTAQSLSRGRA